MMVPEGLLSCKNPHFTDEKAEFLVAIQKALAASQTQALSISLLGCSQDNLGRFFLFAYHRETGALSDYFPKDPHPERIMAIFCRGLSDSQSG